MKRSTKRLIAVVTTAVVVVVGYYIYDAIRIVRHVPEAYAAWDAGTLLVRYMETHDNRWPSSWSDLEELRASEPGLMMRGENHDGNFFNNMKQLVAIDWSYDPNNRIPPMPVTSPDGTPLVCLWRDPNEMVESYLEKQSL